MVRLSGDDGKEYVYEPVLPEDVEEKIRKAGPGMLSAINIAKETFLTMNVSPEVVGDEASKILTGIREKYVFGLMVFREQLLPLSKSTVRAVESTLKLYFWNTSFEDFKTLVPTLMARLEPCKKRAGVAKNKFMLLAADMDQLRIQSDKELKGVITKLEETLDLTARKAKEWKKSAHRMERIGTAANVGLYAGSFALAKGLCTAGGLIPGMPPLVPLVVGAGMFLGSMSKDEASSSVRRYEENEKQCNTVHSKLSDTIQSLLDMHTRGLTKFADCLQGCADFFERLNSRLESLSSSAESDGEIPDDALKIIHREMKNQADEIIHTCSEYGRCASQVETGIQVLDQFKPEKYGKQMEEWAKLAERR